MEKIQRIYMVEYYHHDWCNEDEIREPIKAFVDKKKADAFAKLCEKEKDRIQMSLQAYWMEHKPERDGIANAIRESLLNGTYVKGSILELRQNEIMAGSQIIEQSHKYHPDWSIFQDSDIDYEVNSIELVL